MEVTVIYKGIKFEVDFDYIAPEREIRFDSNNEGHPGHGGGIECINSFEHQGTCFLEFVEDEQDEIDELIFEALDRFEY